MTNRYVAAGGIVFHEDKVLLLNRPGRDEVRLPKGHVEAGESIEDAAIRETQEEAGIACPVMMKGLGVQVHSFHLDGELVQRHEHFFVMRIDEDARMERPDEDHQQFQPSWEALEMAERKLTYESERNAYRKALACWRTPS